MPTKEKTFNILFLSSVNERILIILMLMRESNEIFLFPCALILGIWIYTGSTDVTG